MLHLRLRLTLIVLGLGCSAAPAQAPIRKESRPPASASGRKPDDVARWNDRTTPRKTLETFYFAISGYDRSPDLIANAIDCLDLKALDPEMRERDAALLAHQLEFILNRQAIPLYGVPDRPDGDRVVLDEVAGQPIALARQPDGRWRFDSETVGRIGRLRKLASGGQREAQEAQGRDGRGPDRPRRDDSLVRRRRDGPARLRHGGPMPGPPRHPAQAPRLRGRAAGAEARVRDATVRVHVLAGGPERSRRLPLRLALQPSRADHAGAGPPARGAGRLAVLPRDACATSTPWSKATAPQPPTRATPPSAW